MENIQIITVKNPNETTTEHIIIDRGNGEFTSMPKAVYDAQVEVLTEIIPSETKIK